MEKKNIEGKRAYLVAPLFLTLLKVLLFFLLTPLKLWRLKALNPKHGPSESQALAMEGSARTK
jgi:hypothetical protein